MSKRQERFRVVSVNDPAIETERMTVAEMTAYYVNRDEALIRPFIKPGSQPTWFMVGEIKRRLWASYVLKTAQDDTALRHERAFLAGVDSIENLPQEDAQPISLFEPERSGGIIREEVLERYGLDACTVEEIGSICLEHGFLARRTRRTYRLPPMCLEYLSQRVFRHVASSPSSPAPSSSSTSSATSETPSETAPQPSGSESSTASHPAAGAEATRSTEAA